MDDLDRKALYCCLKLSRMAVYNQLFVGKAQKEPGELRAGIDFDTATLQKKCLEQASTVMVELGRKLDIEALSL